MELAGPFWEVVVKQPTTDFGWLPLYINVARSTEEAKVEFEKS